MKTNLAMTALLGSSLIASAQSNPFYVKADLGGTLTQSTDLKSFFGPVAPGSKVDFDPGLRVGLTGGYHVTDWFGVEATSGVESSEISSITGSTTLHNVSLSNVPFQLGVRFECPHHNRIDPYFGGSVGGSDSVLDADHLTINGVSIHGNGSDVVFAWQAFFGVRYAFKQRMSVGVEYHYFGSDAPEWHSDHVSGVPSNKVSFGGAAIHAITAAFEYRF